MGALVEAVKVACEQEMQRVVNGIYGDMKGVVGGHTRSGEALGSIHIEGGGSHYFVGGNSLHLYYLNEGNGGKGAVIKSTRKYDRKGRKPGKLYLANGRPSMYATQVHGYTGIHFVEEIAAKWR